MLANYKALNKIMDEYIPKMRGKIIEGMHSEQFLSRAHRTLAEGFAEGNIEKATRGTEAAFPLYLPVLCKEHGRVPD